jgi:hypothetical protein
MIEHLRLISKATEKDRYAVVIMDRAAPMIMAKSSQVMNKSINPSIVKVIQFSKINAYLLSGRLGLNRINGFLLACFQQESTEKLY